MDVEVARLLAKAVCIIAMIPTAWAESRIVQSAFQAMARNPKLEESILPKIIISVALVESTAIYALVAFFTI